MCIKHYYSGNYRTCCLKEKQQKTAVFLLYSTSNRFLVNGRKTVLFKTIPIVYKHPFSLFVYFARKVPYFQYYPRRDEWQLASRVVCAPEFFFISNKLTLKFLEMVYKRKKHWIHSVLFLLPPQVSKCWTCGMTSVR